MPNILVRTPSGLKCPMEGQHRKYITDDEKGTSVPDTSFYRRLITEGSLILCKVTAAAVPMAPAQPAASAIPAAPVAPAIAAPQQTTPDASASTEKEAKANVQ
jgi:hypothetical protein